jgi:hypothetical protein
MIVLLCVDVRDMHNSSHQSPTHTGARLVQGADAMEHFDLSRTWPAVQSVNRRLRIAEASRVERGATTVTGLSLPALKTLVQITFQAVMREAGVQSPHSLGFRAFEAAFARKNKACFWPSSQPPQQVQHEGAEGQVNHLDDHPSQLQPAGPQDAQQGEHGCLEQLQPGDAVDGQPGVALILSFVHNLTSTQVGLLLPGRQALALAPCHLICWYTHQDMLPYRCFAPLALLNVCWLLATKQDQR